MELIFKKFPIQGNLEWMKDLAKTSTETREKPFLEFMVWLEEVGRLWEMMAAK